MRRPAAQRRINSSEAGRAGAQAARCRSATASRAAALPSARSRGWPAPPPAAPARSQSSFDSSPRSRRCRGNRQRRHRGRDQAGNDVDQEQPGPRPVVGDPAADDRADGRRQHRDDAADGGRDRMQARAETAGTPRRTPRGSARRRKIPAATRNASSTAKSPLIGAADRGQREHADRDDEQPAQAQHAGEQAGQRESRSLPRSDRRSGSSSSHPARCRAHRWIVGNEVATTWMSRMAMNMPRHIRRKPSPGRARPVASRPPSPAHARSCMRADRSIAESARASARMRIASTAAFRSVKTSASQGRCSASGSSAISAATTA